MIYLELLITGIGLGALYGTAAVGFNLIFSTTRVFDIAIGATFLAAGYGYYTLQQRIGVPWPLAIVIALIIGALIELVFFKGIYQWVEKRSKGSFFGYFVAAFGILTVVQNALQMVYGANAVFVGSTMIEPLNIGPLSVDRGIYLAIAVGLYCYLLVRLVLQHSEAGVLFRGLGENPALLRTVGRATERYRLIAFAMGGVLVAISSVMLVSINGLSPGDGFTNANLAIAAVLVGGVGSYTGGLLGGLLLGVVSSVALQWVSGGWVDAVAFACLLAVLLIRPKGLLGARA